MQPHEMELFRMSMFLVGCMFIGTLPAAWFLRNTQSRLVLIGSGILMFVMIPVMFVVSATNDRVLISLACMVFGASLGASLGTYSVQVTAGRKHAAEAIALTVGLVGLSAMAAAGIGTFSGVNFQSIAGLMFALLMLLLLATIAVMFVRIGRIGQLVFAIASGFFWFVYLIVDFNMIVDRYQEASWSAAANIAMNVFLDMANLFIQLLPLIVDMLDAMD